MTNEMFTNQVSNGFIVGISMYQDSYSRNGELLTVPVVSSPPTFILCRFGRFYLSNDVAVA